MSRSKGDPSICCDRTVEERPFVVLNKIHGQSEHLSLSTQNARLIGRPRLPFVKQYPWQVDANENALDWQALDHMHQEMAIFLISDVDVSESANGHPTESHLCPLILKNLLNTIGSSSQMWNISAIVEHVRVIYDREVDKQYNLPLADAWNWFLEIDCNTLTNFLMSYVNGKCPTSWVLPGCSLLTDLC